VDPLATRSSKEMATAFERGIKFCRSFDRVHLHVRLDNETSVTLKESFKSLSITAEYVGPNNHRKNTAERDLRTFKNHFIATLATADPCFPLDKKGLTVASGGVDTKFDATVEATSRQVGMGGTAGRV
jgi:hypothetical protein